MPDTFSAFPVFSSFCWTLKASPKYDTPTEQMSEEVVTDPGNFYDVRHKQRHRNGILNGWDQLEKTNQRQKGHIRPPRLGRFVL